MPTLSALWVIQENSMERWPSHEVTVEKRFVTHIHVCASKCCYSFLFVSWFVDHVFFRQTWCLAAKPFYKRKYKLLNRNKLFDLFFPPLAQSNSSNALKSLVNKTHGSGGRTQVKVPLLSESEYFSWIFCYLIWTFRFRTKTILL